MNTLPPLSQSDYTQLKNSIAQDGQSKATTILCNDRMSIKMATIYPSIHKGYYYVCLLRAEEGTTHANETKRPIHWEGIEETLEIMGLDVNVCKWRLEKCGLLDRPPSELGKHHEAESLVYFIGGGGLIKIGVAESPQTRLKTLQTGSPVPLQLLAVCDGGYKRETELHERFAQDCEHGEWFTSSLELEEYINELSSNATTGGE